MVESVLQLKDLITVSALDPDLINNVVQVSVLLLRLERCHALTALCTALGQPCLNAVLMEDLLAAATLDRAE